MTPPPVWTPEELEKARLLAIEDFIDSRDHEPVEDYSQEFDIAQGQVETILETLVDLTLLRDADRDEVRPVVRELLSDPDLLSAFRYVAGPPISEDDLKTVARSNSLAAVRLKLEPQLVDAIVQAVYSNLDRQRFPWVMVGQSPEPHETAAAVLSTASLIAYQRYQTARRHLEKKRQEDAVAQALVAAGFTSVKTRTIHTLTQAPAPGTFCRESTVAGRKADIVIGLYDSRTMLVECKVSNSSTNSVKRLNNDAAVKAVSWRKALGDVPVVPAAVLAGVFKLHNLEDAQQRGLTLFWAHSIDVLATWAASTSS